MRSLQHGGEFRPPRFVSEGHAGSGANHPSIVTIHEIGGQEGSVFIAMGYVAGRAPDALISGTELPLADTLTYAIPTAAALAKAHAAGVVHCDLKPGNILIAWESTLKLPDFVLAKAHRWQVSVNRGERGTVETGRGGKLLRLGSQVDGRQRHDPPALLFEKRLVYLGYSRPTASGSSFGRDRPASRGFPPTASRSGG